MRIIAFGNEVTVTRLTASLPWQEVELVARLRAVLRRFWPTEQVEKMNPVPEHLRILTKS